jgi:hypothetical protein
VMLGADYAGVGPPPIGCYPQSQLRCLPAKMAVNPRNGEIALTDIPHTQFLVSPPELPIAKRSPTTCTTLERAKPDRQGSQPRQDSMPQFRDIGLWWVGRS